MFDRLRAQALQGFWSLLTASFCLVPAWGSESADINALLSDGSTPFVPNHGQWGDVEGYLMRRGPCDVSVTSTGIQISKLVEEGRRERVEIRILGDSDPTVIAEAERETRFSFLRSSKERSVSGIPGFDRLRILEASDGVDIVVRASGSLVEYDLFFDADQDVGAIRFEVRGDSVEGLHLDDEGRLVISTASGGLVQDIPRSWCLLEDGEERPFTPSFRILGERVFGFEASDRMAGRPCVIDPKFDWGVYHGGSHIEYGEAIDIFDEVTANGVVSHIIVAGSTQSFDFVQPPTFDAVNNDGTDIFVSSFDSNGVLNWSTYVGDDGWDEMATGVAVDQAVGDVTVCGYIIDPDPDDASFPTYPTFRAFQGGYGGGTTDGVLTQLGSTGMTVNFSTFFGGTERDVINDVESWTPTLEVVVVGVTGSSAFSSFPTAPPLLAPHGGEDAFIARFVSTGVLARGAYVGGTDFDEAYGVEFDGSDTTGGTAIMTGITYSADYHTAPPNFFGAGTRSYTMVYGGSGDAFVTSVTNSGGAGFTSSYSTYLGGEFEDYASDAVDSTRCLPSEGLTARNPIHVIGQSAGSTMFPRVQPSSCQGPPGSVTTGPSTSGFLCRLNVATTGASSLEYSVDPGFDPTALAIDSADQLVLIGGHTAINPTNDALQSGANEDVVVRYAPRGDGFLDVLYASYLGGEGQDAFKDVAFSPHANFVVVGDTDSTNIPGFSGGLFSGPNGPSDAIVTSQDLCTSEGDSWRPAHPILAWYPFDDLASSSAAVDIARGLNGVRHGTTSVPSGLVDGALFFDGIDDHVEIPQASDLSFARCDFSINFWVRLHGGAGSTIGLVDKRDLAGSGRGYTVFVDSMRRLNFTLVGANGSRTYVLDGFDMVDRCWHHVCINVDRDEANPDIVKKVRLFVDFCYFNYFQSGDNIGTIYSGATPVLVGNLHTAADPGFLFGEMDELQFYPRFLGTYSGVHRIFQAGGFGRCKPPTSIADPCDPEDQFGQ